MKEIPVMLSGSTISLTENSSGVTDGDTLSSPFGETVAIDSIAFIARLDGNNSILTPNLGGTIAVQFAIGNKLISTHDVPIWCFGPALQSDSINQFESVLGLGSAFVTNKFTVHSHFLWKPPVPILVPPGGHLHGYCTRGVDALGGTVVLDMAYRGRRLKDFRFPVDARIPYVARFISAENPAGGVVQSAEVDLRTQFSTPLHIQRFVARMQLRDSNGLTEKLGIADADLGLVRIRSSEGHWLTNDYVPFSTVFDDNRRAWTTGFELQPREAILMQFVNLPSGNITVDVGMIGWRTERWGAS